MSVTILGEEYLIATTTTLDLSNKSLTEMPESIGSLFNLQELHLDNNNLISLPNSIGSLSNLRELYLYNNKITSLPDSIGMLSNLQKLYLQDNNLTNLPESIGSLSNLKELYLYYNNLISVPESIATLTKIENFVLDESSYDINNLSMDCHTLVLTDIDNNVINLPPIITKLYLKHCVDADMIKLHGECDIIRF